jgi:hypothetical protein
MGLAMDNVTTFEDSPAARETAMDDDGNWHLDKKVPIGLMLGLALNAGLGIWYASKLDSRISYLEQDGVRTSLTIDKIQQTGSANENRLTRVEDHTESILDIVRRLEGRRDPFPRELPSDEGKSH